MTENDMVNYGNSLLPSGFTFLLDPGYNDFGYEAAIKMGRSFHAVTTPAFPLFKGSTESDIKDVVMQGQCYLNDFKTFPVEGRVEA